MKSPTVLVILGATGDLSQNKLFPALLDLHEAGILPENFRIVGFSRRDFDTEKFRDFVETSLSKKGRGHFSKSVKKFSKRFEKNLRDWKKDNATGKIIITQGAGIDGHTLGMMPYPENPKLFFELFEKSSLWVRGYETKGKGRFPKRVTATTRFLRDMVDESIAYITGKEKKGAFKKLQDKKGELAKTPARIMREMKRVSIFTDISL